jgi:hypothetical protein
MGLSWLDLVSVLIWVLKVSQDVPELIILPIQLSSNLQVNI